MSTSAPAAGASAALSDFTRTTSRVGTATMLVGLLLSLAGPVYLYFFTDLGITPVMVAGAYVSVAVVFGVLWVVEPLSYYPVLGSSAMYQAFMIGNISSKLLPAAVVAQDSVGAKPGTPRGDLAAVMAICGAAVMHLTSLAVFVGLLGTWLLTVLPADLMAVVRTAILPAVLGAVGVQAVMSYRNWRITAIALIVGALVTFVLLPAVPALAFFGVAITVILTVVLSVVLRPRGADADAELHY
ncbi:hypothetical protein [Micrococcus endophyticus]|uniref:hypothetical protein n=1 Tax=Micrococcus endophyticus TaxID=455343 RepID=UPI0034CEAFC1